MDINIDSNDGEWKEWRRLIFHEIQRQNEDANSISVRVGKVEMSVAKLNLLAAIFGSIGGVLATFLVQMFIGGF